MTITALIFIAFALTLVFGAAPRFADGPTDQEIDPVQDDEDDDSEDGDDEPGDSSDEDENEEDDDEDDEPDDGGGESDALPDLSDEYARAAQLAGGSAEPSIEEETGLTRAQLKALAMQAKSGTYPIAPVAAPPQPRPSPQAGQPINLFEGMEPDDAISVQDARKELGKAFDAFEQRLRHQDSTTQRNRVYTQMLDAELDSYSCLNPAKSKKPMTTEARRAQALAVVDAALAQIGKVNGQWTHQDLQREVAKMAQKFYQEDGSAPGVTPRQKRQVQTGPPRSGGVAVASPRKPQKEDEYVDLTNATKMEKRVRETLLGKRK